VVLSIDDKLNGASRGRVRFRDTQLHDESSASSSAPVKPNSRNFGDDVATAATVLVS
jgi:hypothetical protein